VIEAAVAAIAFFSAWLCVMYVILKDETIEL